MNQLMPPQLRADRSAKIRLAIADCDMHPTPNSTC